MANPGIEKRRLAALERLGILDTPPEERFERLTRIAKHYYGVKTALFSVLDAERQWFKSRQGLDESETPRSVAFCDYAIQQDKILLVEDAAKDPRFRNNPLVTGKPHIRFYAGMPVREPSGFKIGTLCIIDDKPRMFTEIELDVLRSLASIVEDELERAFLSTTTGEYVKVSHLSRAIHRAQNVFLTSDNEHAAFELMLNDLLALTGSQFGFIGEVLQRNDDAPFLKIGAITNIAWSPETQALYQEVERRGMIFDRLDNILGLPMTTGEVIVSDSVASDSRAKGLPEGHPPITAYIGIPVFSGDRQIGLIGLANRLGGYTARLAEELEPLMQTVGNLIERKRLYQEKREHQKHLEQAANYDALTGLPNRRRMTELFEQELFEANQREGLVSVCFIDLDGFKDINDQHGHAVGDAVLKSVADRLLASVRAHDVVARLGGDEFVAILRDVNDERVYARLLEAISQPINYKRNVLHLSGSMGVTVYPEDDSDADQLLRHADQAMYAAKEAGKNNYVLFDLDSHYSRKERIKVIEQMGTALELGQLELYYQPKIHFGKQRVEGFEALIRWNHPEDGLLGPGHFLDHIEYTEYARKVGNFVLGEAITRLQEFQSNELPYTISVNLSPSHFLGPGFRDDLEAALYECPVAIRSRLILEVLETTTLDDTDRVLENVSACRELGVDVSLDDFGTGYSSLDLFRRLAAQEIKIDRSFVFDMLDNPDSDMIVSAIISLSKSFRRRLVAEGIESAEVEAKLIELGCELGQGFFYSKPLPLKQALEWAQRFEWQNRDTRNDWVI
ncbi:MULTISPECIES: sensor domain-containing phosphodiesterase [unclassified Marinobacter]|uniref:sensor domain-containing phosphodiesterase n=1 Tax=unclassified Marinobacter TaxID=83889 RepID=UPI001925EE34|nr:MULTISPECIES: EAL domain-containing protein [unclassified Marinobacter]MBL3823598.1 EAL domain-containing protein [Marinobacter sp. MC3]MBL3891754.1 EAL domain-containing protein [Marinobacter sp. MW3]